MIENCLLNALSPKGKECTLDKKFCSPTFSVHLTHKPVVPRCASFHRLCCQNLWEATRKSQPIVAMWNPRAGATPSCIWWRAFLGILESSQLLTVLLNLPTVDNFHFLLLHSEDKLLRYSCNRSNRPLRSDCGMLWAKLTKLESPPAPPAIQFPQWSPPWLCLPARSVGSQPDQLLY